MTRSKTGWLLLGLVFFIASVSQMKAKRETFNEL